MTHSSFRCTAITGSLLAVALSSHAQSPQPDGQPVKTLPRVTVVADEAPPYTKQEATGATKVEAPIRDIPQSIVVVGEDLLHERGVAKLSESLDTVAGIVRESVYGGNTATAGFTARGFRVAQLRDGMRLSIQGFGDALDIGAVESIEVLKGPASVLYGASEPGATINIVSKKPQTEFGIGADTSIDSFGTGRVGVDLNLPLVTDKLLVRVNAAHEDGDTYRDFVDRRTSLLAPVLEWRPREGTQITLRYEHVRTVGLFDRGLGWIDSYLGSGIDFRDLPAERFLGEPSANPSRNDTSQILAKVDQQLGANWSIRAAYSDVQFDWNSQAEINLDTFEPDTGLFTRYFGDYERQGENTRIGLIELLGNFNVGSTQHQLLVGADDLENRAFYIGLNGNPPPAPIDVFEPVYPGYTPNAEFWFSGLQGSSGHSFYAQDLITLSDQWKVLVAARHDSSRRYSGAYPGQPDDSGEVSEHEFDRTSPRAGVVYQPNGTDSYYGSFNTSFAPSLFITMRDPSAFKPEIGKQFELGWKREWVGGRFSSTLSAFEIRKQNVAQSDPANTPDEFFEVQVGEFQSRGVELDASGEIRPGLRGTIGIGYAEVTVSESQDPSIPVGERIDNFPELTASLWLAQDLGETWSIGAGLFHAGGSPTTLPGNGVSIPGYTRVDATLTWRQGPWRLQLSGKNLTDETYYAASNTIMPQAPRHGLLTANYTF